MLVEIIGAGLVSGVAAGLTQRWASRVFGNSPDRWDSTSIYPDYSPFRTRVEVMETHETCFTVPASAGSRYVLGASRFVVKEPSSS